MEVFKVFTPDPEIVFVEHPITEVKQRMILSQTDYMFVVDGDQVVGAIDRNTLEHQLSRKLARRHELAVSEFMSSEVLIVSIDETISAARAAMLSNGYRIAAVVDQNGQLVGTVTLDQVNGEKPISSVSPSDKILPRNTERTVGAPPAPDEGSRGTVQRGYTVKPNVLRPDGGGNTSGENT